MITIIFIDDTTIILNREKWRSEFPWEPRVEKSNFSNSQTFIDELVLPPVHQTMTMLHN